MIRWRVTIVNASFFGSVDQANPQLKRSASYTCVPTWRLVNDIRIVMEFHKRMNSFPGKKFVPDSCVTAEPDFRKSAAYGREYRRSPREVVFDLRAKHGVPLPAVALTSHEFQVIIPLNVLIHVSARSAPRS